MGSESALGADKIALVIEGGGFKSVFSAGVLDAFLINGFNPFHMYIGVSSGAMALSYYIAGQYNQYFQISTGVYSNLSFLNYKNTFSDQGYMNLKFLEKYAKDNHPLDIEKIKTNIKEKDFYIVATNLEDGSPVYLDQKQMDIYKSLRATATLPFFTKGSCRINSLSVMDGGWSDPIPAKKAANLGANKIIVIRQNPLEYKITGLSYLGIIAGYWWKDNLEMKNNFVNGDINYNNQVDFLSKQQVGLEILQICPEKELKSSVIGTTEKDLITDYHCGLQKGLDFLHSELF